MNLRAISEFFQRDLFGKEPPIGIDISNESIILVEIKKLRGVSGLELVKVGMAPTPPNAVRDGEIVDPNRVAETIQQIKDVHEFKAKRAIVAVSGQAAIIRSPLKFRAVPKKELEEVILFQAERYIPFAVDDVNIDYEIINKFQDEEGEKVEVLLVAAQKQLINTYVDTLSLAGFELVAVDVASFAVARALTGEHTLGEDKLIVLVLIRSETTDINILKSGVPRFSRSIPIGSSTFIETIASNLNLELEESIQLFDKMVIPIPGSPPITEPLIEQAAKELKSTWRELTSEIQRSLEYFHAQQEGDRVQQLILSGRGSYISNLDQYLSTNLGIDVEIANPINYLYFDENLFPVDFLMENAAIMATAIGLARRGVEEY